MLAARARFFNQTIMEGSLTSMDVHLPPTFHHEQCNEEMKQLLLCATLELQSVKAEERAHEAKLRHHEAQVRHLQDALFKVRKERDEYRDKCNQLQARLSRSPSLGSGLSDGITVNLSNVQQMESVSSMPETTRATLSEVHRHMEQQLDFPHLEMQQHLHHQLDLPHQHMVDLDLSHDNNHHMSPQQLEQLQQHLEMHQDNHAHEQLALDMHSPDRQSASAQCTDGRNPSSANSTPWSDFATGVQVKMHSSEQSCNLMDESIRLQMELSQGVSGSHLDQHSPGLEDFHGHLQHQQQEQQMQMQLQLHQRQQRQESELLLAHMQHQQRNANPSHHHLADEQPCHSRLSEGQDVGHSMSVLQHPPWQRTPQSCSMMQNGLGSPSVTNMGTVPSFSVSSPPIPSGHQASQLLQNGSAVASILSPLERYGESPSSNLLPPRPLHLPEPPEANAQVILSTLPEKGKLLQAVMQAGPLLQTLMLAGPLPQWRHPPPAMDSLEIPRVSMGTSTMTVPSSEHSSPVNVMCRNGSNFGHMRMSNSMHSSSPNGLCHANTTPVSAISSMAAGFDRFSSPLNPTLCSQRSLPQLSQIPQRSPLSNSHLSHDVSLLEPPLKYAKIH